eukprot:c6981_g1_i1.p3 GENE.c6981_g1_i1~~c6981_g1_i1.p3  ORF type:complete len:170 (+),score=31.07 c6981_g1_i1:788-1297(+)
MECVSRGRGAGTPRCAAVPARGRQDLGEVTTALLAACDATPPRVAIARYLVLACGASLASVSAGALSASAADPSFKALERECSLERELQTATDKGTLDELRREFRRALRRADRRQVDEHKRDLRALQREHARTLAELTSAREMLGGGVAGRAERQSDCEMAPPAYESVL